MVADWRGHLVVVRNQSSGCAERAGEHKNGAIWSKNWVRGVGAWWILEGMLYGVRVWLGLVVFPCGGFRLVVRNSDEVPKII